MYGNNVKKKITSYIFIGISQPGAMQWKPFAQQPMKMSWKPLKSISVLYTLFKPSENHFPVHHPDGDHVKMLWL